MQESSRTDSFFLQGLSLTIISLIQAILACLYLPTRTIFNLSLETLLSALKKLALVLSLLFSMENAVAFDPQRMDILERRLNHVVSAQIELNVDHRLGNLITGIQSDKEKAWLIYQWVIRQFSHDLKLSARIGDPDKHSLDELFRFGGGSCAVYANVTQRLFDKAGLQARTVYGTAKSGTYFRQFGSMPVNHVWNMLKVDGRWHTVDSTWGAGFVGDQGFERAPNEMFFLMPPEMAVLSHFDKKDQFGYQKKFGVTASLFRKIPEDAVYAAGMGFDPLELLNQQSRFAGEAVVKTFEHSPSQFKVIIAPVQRRLPKRPLKLQLESKVFNEMVVVQGKKWIHLHKRGDTHALELNPDRGDLVVMARRNPSSDYEALLAYQVR